VEKAISTASTVKERRQKTFFSVACRANTVYLLKPKFFAVFAVPAVVKKEFQG
jgi:hypothetical protein